MGGRGEMKNKGDEKEEVRKRGGAMRHGKERIKMTGDETKRGEDQRE